MEEEEEQDERELYKDRLKSAELPVQITKGRYCHHGSNDLSRLIYDPSILINDRSTPSLPGNSDTQARLTFRLVRRVFRSTEQRALACVCF